jgi:hypothetical protein
MKTRENGRKYTPSIAPLEAPVSDCGMGLGGTEASTARRSEVWRRGVVGTAPFQISDQKAQTFTFQFSEGSRLACGVWWVLLRCGPS